MRYTFRTAAVAVMIATLATAGVAQGVGSGGGAGVGREAGRGGGVGVGREAGRRGGTSTLGWAGALECMQCTVHISPSGNWVEFGAEPVVRGRIANGGLLLDGDVVVAVDGILITTAAGGRLLSGNASAGLPTRLTIRRGGKQIEVAMPQHIAWIADSIVWRSSDSLRAWQVDSGLRGRLKWQMGTNGFRDTSNGALRRTISGRDTTYYVVPPDTNRGRLTYSFGRGTRVDSAGRGLQFKLSPLIKQRSIGVGRGTLLPRAMNADSSRLRVRDSTGMARDEMSLSTTRGLLGIALDCLRCSVDREDRSSRDHAVRFTTPPTVVAIEPGVASAAGFRVGDIIRTIDGQSIITVGGSQRFHTLRAGERVRFVVERGKQLVNLTLVVPRAY